ncbi:hypothetical protein RB195_016324 [Necator americanus]
MYQKLSTWECGPRIEDSSTCADGTELNKLDCFKYLGSKVTSTDDIDQEGRALINVAWMKWKMATGILCDKKVPVRLKSKICRTVVLPFTDASAGGRRKPWKECCTRMLRLTIGAKRQRIKRHCTLHLRRRPDN